MANINSLEQGRASKAYEYAKQGENLNIKEYKSYVKSIPMMIKTNGLGATLAFIFSKSKWKDKDGKEKLNTYALIYRQTEDWIGKEKGLLVFEEKQLVYKITKIKSEEYRYITTEVLALYTWLRRFAEGLSNE